MKKKFKTTFPVARIKKIMQKDDEVGKIAQATPVLISRCIELFMSDLVEKSCDIARSKKSKVLAVSHLKQCVREEQEFDFLRELIDSVPDSVETDSRKGRPRKDNLLGVSSDGLETIETIDEEEDEEEEDDLDEDEDEEELVSKPIKKRGRPPKTKENPTKDTPLPPNPTKKGRKPSTVQNATTPTFTTSSTSTSFTPTFTPSTLPSSSLPIHSFTFKAPTVKFNNLATAKPKASNDNYDYDEEEENEEEEEEEEEELEESGSILPPPAKNFHPYPSFSQPSGNAHTPPLHPNVFSQAPHSSFPSSLNVHQQTTTRINSNNNNNNNNSNNMPIANRTPFSIQNLLSSSPSQNTSDPTTIHSIHSRKGKMSEILNNNTNDNFDLISQSGFVFQPHFNNNNNTHSTAATSSSTSQTTSERESHSCTS